jgi:molybdopterin-guanine dinucleotide biosynthesis protein A
MSASAAPVHGLILAGGQSIRMRQDKASLLYRGRSQLDRAHELAARHVAKVFVSVRASQVAEPTRAGRSLIIDSVEGEGPLVGICSAFAAHPEAAWLVIACDLPFLSDTAVEQLLRERDPTMMATAFVSTHDRLPEPLCAIWEPAATPAIAAYRQSGRQCPRKFLITHPVRLLEPRDRRALDNVNTPDEYRDARSALEAAPAVRAVHVQYFAVLREQAGRSEETLDTPAATPAALYMELSDRYRFSLTREQLKVAVNGEFAEWSQPLDAGDAVVFIPPVAGG